MPRDDRDGDDLRDGVAVEFDDPRAEFLEALAPRLEDQERLLVAADFPLPAIDGADRPDEVAAGGELFLDERRGDLLGLVALADRHEDDAEVSVWRFGDSGNWR